MTRIISGRAGGTALQVPDAGTRPTSDRVRESLFSALESADELDDAVVLDLYAGSGALGLEALSRGAAVADLVEQSAAAARVIERNATRVAPVTGAAARTHRVSALTYLRTPRGPYTLVFIDPPYDIGEDELAATLRALAPHLAPDALVIVERAKRSPEPDWTGTGLDLERAKAYGDTTMWWARAQPTAESQS